MARGEKRLKQHVISLRVSSEEWDSLHEAMKGQKFKRVSDIMREAFKLVLTPAGPFEAAHAEGQKRIG
jgi:hypothetical protein